MKSILYGILIFSILYFGLFLISFLQSNPFDYVEKGLMALFFTVPIVIFERKRKNKANRKEM
jgi:hypothetical protein